MKVGSLVTVSAHFDRVAYKQPQDPANGSTGLIEAMSEGRVKVLWFDSPDRSWWWEGYLEEITQ